MKLILELETSDPDDFLTLLFLADHPRVDLQAVVVTPGSADQCALVRAALVKLGRPHVPIGALHGPSWWAKKDGQKPRVSGFHYKVYGEDLRDFDPGEVRVGPELVGSLLADPQADVTYLSGAPPKNLGAAHRLYGELRLARWVCQGGFAGDNVVPPEHVLPKFRGMTTCPTFNLGGAVKESLELLASDRIRRRVLVSKNVCHGVVWTRAIHEELGAILQRLHWDAAAGRGVLTQWPGELGVIPKAVRPGLRTMTYGLDRYLQDKGMGKAMHDILAAAVALDERVCDFAEVELYREAGKWGSRPAHGSRTWISIAHHHDRFLDVLADHIS